MKTTVVGTSGFPKPVVAGVTTIIPGGINGWEIPQEDFTPAADLFVQKLIEKNAAPPISCDSKKLPNVAAISGSSR